MTMVFVTFYPAQYYMVMRFSGVEGHLPWRGNVLGYPIGFGNKASTCFGGSQSTS